MSRKIGTLARLRKTVGGMLDYLRHKDQKQKWGGPFNNQVQRQRIFLELIEAIPFVSIVETGTFRGTTTAYLQEATGLPVFTVEVQPRKYGYARARFLRNRMIHVSHGDSRAFLRRLAERGLDPRAPTFFYLDAHWTEDLPLREEIDIVFGDWPQAVVMIDDFRVPGDSGYGYDDYGEGKVLESAYLDTLGRNDLMRFFPQARSDNETGKRRGCIVLVKDDDLADRIAAITSLRLFHLP
jgi:predicted O-methyltransferase YrrM